MLAAEATDPIDRRIATDELARTRPGTADVMIEQPILPAFLSNRQLPPIIIEDSPNNPVVGGQSLRVAHMLC